MPQARSGPWASLNASGAWDTISSKPGIKLCSCISSFLRNQFSLKFYSRPSPMVVKCLCFNAAVWKLAHHNYRSVRLIEVNNFKGRQRVLLFQHMQAISQLWDSRWLSGHSGLLFACWDNLFNGVTQNWVNSETQWRYLGGEEQCKKKMVTLSQCVVRMERGPTESSHDHVIAIYHTVFWQELC